MLVKDQGSAYVTVLQKMVGYAGLPQREQERGQVRGHVSDHSPTRAKDWEQR